MFYYYMFYYYMFYYYFVMVWDYVGIFCSGFGSV